MTATEPLRKPMAIAHRGARAEAPENTASAFEKALTYPVDGIELDVQMSADGVPVIHHDRTLKKTAGSRRRPADLSFSSLRRLDAGSWFSPAFAGEPLLGFDEMLDRFAGRTRLFMEIKVFEVDRRSGRAAGLADRVLASLSRFREPEVQASFHILSFDIETLRYARHRAPHLQYVLDVTRADAKRLNSAPAGLLDPLAALCIHCGGISRRRVERLHQTGKRVFAYTCNDAATLKKMLAADVDAILTDDPAWLTRELSQRVRKHDGEYGEEFI